MKCPKCEKELQPNWQVCPSCGTKITAVRICSNCKKEIEAGSMSCPYCGFATGETPSLSASIKESVIKEIHQTQNIYHESRPLGTPEYQYEKYVLAVLESGGSLERARAQLEQRREQLGLSLKQSKEVEQHCLALNKNEAAPLKSEETQNQRITANISSGNSISKVTRQNRLPKWGILVGCVTLLIIGTVVFINNKHTPDRVPSITVAHTTSSQVSPATTSTSIKTATIPSTSSITSVPVHVGTPISYGQEVIGQIKFPGDYEEWTFTGQAGDIITIHTFQNGGASLYPEVELLDPSRAKVAEGNWVGMYAAASEYIIANSNLRFSGVYTIRVYSY